jgi:hypothetical protein
MSILKTITGTIRAGLSGKEITTQYSRPRNTTQNNTLFGYTYNKNGPTQEDYEAMLRDPQIKSGFEHIRMFLLSRKIIITPASDDPEDIEIARKTEQTLNNMKYPLRKVRNDIYTALAYGYSVSEVLYTKEKNKDYIGIERIRPIPIDTLNDCFVYDDKGDIETVIQRVDNEDIPIPADKCLIYTYDEKFGDREGQGLLDSLYDLWYQKKKIETLRLIYLQKHEGPTLVAFMDDPQYKDLARDQLDEIKEGRTNATFGANDRVEVLESSHRGEGFDKAIDYYNTMMYRVMGIGTLIMGQQEGKGAYSQSQTQEKVMSIRFDGIHEDIAAELQVKVNDWCNLNWDLTEYPTVGFETFEEKNLIELINALKPLLDTAAVDPMDHWFRSLIRDVVGRYSDVDTNELLEDNSDVLVHDHIVEPTVDEQGAGQSPEQSALIDEVSEIIPVKEE